jgi:hypothetical protein
MPKFVLTVEEKRVVAFLLAALLLGASVKVYRSFRPLRNAPAEGGWRRVVSG